MALYVMMWLAVDCNVMCLGDLTALVIAEPENARVTAVVTDFRRGRRGTRVLASQTFCRIDVVESKPVASSVVIAGGIVTPSLSSCPDLLEHET